MSELTLRFSSKNRQKVGVSLSHDFTTRFNNPIKLSYNMKHELAVITISMTYSWYNIRQSYGNNQIKYSHNNGTNWETITFVDGMYSYDDIDKYIKKYLKSKEHFVKGDKDSKDIEDITCPRVDMNFIFEWSTRYLTSERSERVRYRVDHEKIKFISISGHVMFCLLYKHQ